MRTVGFLALVGLFTSCETSIDSTIRIYNGLSKNDIIVWSYKFPDNRAVIGPQALFVADKGHGINSSCGAQFDHNYMQWLRIDSIGKIEGADTVYSQVNFNLVEEWVNICRERKSGILDDYVLGVEESDF